MLRITIEQDNQAETHPHGQTTVRFQHMSAQNGGPPAIGSHHAIRNSLPLTAQLATMQHARGTAQSAGTAPRIVPTRRKATN